MSISNSMILLLMKTFVVEMFNNLCKITVADVHMKSTDLMYTCVCMCSTMYYIWYCLTIFHLCFVFLACCASQALTINYNCKRRANVIVIVILVLQLYYYNTIYN